MNLFVDHSFVSNSGNPLDFKIDCDALSDDDLATLAIIIAKRIKFGAVEGIPHGTSGLWICVCCGHETCR